MRVCQGMVDMWDNLCFSFSRLFISLLFACLSLSLSLSIYIYPFVFSLSLSSLFSFYACISPLHARLSLSLLAAPWQV